MSGDPVGQLIEEITALRRSVEHLARTSLDKDEAKTLNELVVEAVDRMTEAAVGARSAVRRDLEADRAQTRAEAVQSATAAAQGAVEGVKAELVAARKNYDRAAGEARREAWSWFGGFWVWIASMLATGALLGVLGATWIGGRGDAAAFGRFPGFHCTAAGGIVVPQSDGGSFCAIWIDEPAGERP